MSKSDPAEILAKSEAFLARHGDHADNPELHGRICSALYGAAWARGQLGQLSASLAGWDRFLAAAAERDWSEANEAMLANALWQKGSILAKLGRDADTAAVAAEIIVRFRHSDDGDVRLGVAVALSQRSYRLLRNPATLAQGLAVSDELIELLWAEPDATLVPVAEVAVNHIRAVMNAHSQTLPGFAAAGADIVLNGAAAATTAVGRWLAARTPLPAPEQIPVPDTLTRLLPSSLERTRIRLRHALELCQAVLSRLEPLPDGDAAAVRARVELHAAIAKATLGRFPEAMRTLTAMEERRNEDVARAYQTMVDQQPDKTSVFGQLTTAAMLANRARALIGDDPKMARVAYEDSLASQLPASRPWPVRLVLRLIAPGK